MISYRFISNFWKYNFLKKNFSIKVTSIDSDEYLKSLKRKKFIKQNGEEQEENIKIFTKKDVTLNKDMYELNYSRSSGPGGQHVNKTNSKVELRVNLKKYNSDKKFWDNMKKIYNSYINKEGFLILKNQETRSQQQNLTFALEKAKEYLANGLNIKKDKEYELFEETLEMKKKRIDLKRKKSDYRNVRGGL